MPTTPDIIEEKLRKYLDEIFAEKHVNQEWRIEEIVSSFNLLFSLVREATLDEVRKRADKLQEELNKSYQEYLDIAESVSKDHTRTSTEVAIAFKRVQNKSASCFSDLISSLKQ